MQATAGEQWQYYLGDADLGVRQLVSQDGLIILARTYAPYGILLAQEGSGTALFGYALLWRGLPHSLWSVFRLCRNEFDSRWVTWAWGISAP